MLKNAEHGLKIILTHQVVQLEMNCSAKGAFLAVKAEEAVVELPYYKSEIKKIKFTIPCEKF